ncbi:hypothetical protein QL285_072526 [Trifolium repens]|nr:hypothetical protein QL285_072526 [Trifolium repens]
MDLKLRIFIVIFLLLFVELYPARVNSLRIVRSYVLKPSTQVSNIEMKGRELMKVDMDDYSGSGSNHKGKGHPVEP